MRQPLTRKELNELVDFAWNDSPDRVMFAALVFMNDKGGVGCALPVHSPQAVLLGMFEHMAAQSKAAIGARYIDKLKAARKTKKATK